MPDRITVSGYSIIDRIGSGSIGDVFRAMSILSSSEVAIKRLRSLEDSRRPQGFTTVDAKLSLMDEFRLLASLHHPNIIRVLDYGFDLEMQPYLVMELLQNAQTLTDASEQLPFGQQVRLLVQLLQALIYLHRRSVLHADLKPSNILVSHGTLKVIDFGIAVDKQTALGAAGTIPYMAPEIILGAAPSRASDLYAVGVLAHQVVLGGLPFKGVTSNEILKEIVGDGADILGVSAASEDETASTIHFQVNTHIPIYSANDCVVDLGAYAGQLGPFITRLLQRNPQSRFQNAHEALGELLALSGISMPMESYETRESFLQNSAFIGRTAEMANLREAVAQCLSGHGSGWLLGGESGVGKSRLVSEVKTFARVRGLSVVTGEARSDGGSPYRLWLGVLLKYCLQTDVSDDTAGVLVHLLPELRRLSARHIEAAPPLYGDAAKLRLFDAIKLLLSSSRFSTLIVLEDLHWADLESLELLRYLFKHLCNTATMFLVTYRDDERRSLPQELPGMHTMTLARMGADDTSELLKKILGHDFEDPEFTNFLVKETEGNIFFMIEILRALAEEAGALSNVRLPSAKSISTEGIQRIIAKRLRSFSEADLRLLSLASVVGRKVELDVLQKLGPHVDWSAWLIRCANAAVIESVDGTWRFSHDKIREFIADGLSSSMRRDLETRVAIAMESLYGEDDAFAAELAIRWSRLGRGQYAAHFYMAAGAHAERSAAPKAGRDLYAEGLHALHDITDSLDVCRQRADLAIACAQCSWTAERPALILSNLKDAEQRLQKVCGGDPDIEDQRRLARLQLWCGRVEMVRGANEIAIGHYRRALALGEKLRDDSLIVYPRVMITQALVVQGFWGNWESLARDLNYMNQHASFIEAARVAGYIASGLAAAGRLPEAKRYVQPYLDRAQAAGNRRAVAFLSIYLALMYVHAGSLPTAERACTEIIACAQATGDTLLEFIGHGLNIWAMGRAGKYAEGLASMERESHLRKVLGQEVLLGDWIDAAKSELLLATEQYDEAKSFTHALLEQSTKNDRVFSAGLGQRVFACLYAHDGAEWTRSRMCLMRSCDSLLRASMSLEVARTHLAWSRLANAAQKFDEAQLHYAAYAQTFAEAGLEVEPFLNETKG